MRAILTWISCAVALIAADVAPPTPRLNFVSRAIEVVASAGDKQTSATFTCTNTGPTAITILDHELCCGLTWAKNPPARIEPGASAAFALTLSLNNHTTPFAQTATLITNDPVNPVVVLTTTVIMPIELRLSPARLVWSVGGQPETRRVSIRYLPTQPRRIISVAEVTGLFQVITHPDPTSGLMQSIDVTPSRMDRREAQVELRLDNGAKVLLPLSIQPPPLLTPTTAP
ncbi:MAG: DUF1573 domain-containing protein [Planctomycetota bacterium]